MARAAADAVAFQRELHVREEEEARDAIAAQGCDIVSLSPEQHEAFKAAVRPIYGEARERLGDKLLELAGLSPERTV